jgi:leucine dehydrogenase
VPDYAVNSGGIINGVAEGPDYDRARVWERLDRIYDQCLEVFATARANDTSSLEAANLIAERKMRDLGQRP